MERMRNALKKNGGVILFFLVFLVYGLLTVQDYGISTDEMIERDSSLIAYRYIVPSVGDIVTETVNFPELPPLKEYVYRYYGVAVQLPAVAVEHLFGFRLDIRKVFLMRHLYNFLVYFAAVCFFYRICRKLGNGKGMSLLGTALLILMPRLLANAFYNVKDMMFFSVFIIALYFGLLCVERLSWGRMALFGFFGALCTNVRVVGAMVIVVCLVLSFARSMAEKRWKPAFWRCWVTAAFCFGFYFLLTPIIWRDSFREIINLLNTFSNYMVWYANTYFCGRYILSTELPWYYLFLNIGITTPIFYLLLFFAGVAALAVHGFSGGRQWLAARRGRKGQEGAASTSAPFAPPLYGWYYLAIILCMAIPFAYVLISRPVLYNGWRHFYFVYPMMVLIMVYGMKEVGNLAWRTGKKPVLYGYCGVVSACLLAVLLWIGRNHPYEYCFFNTLARPYVTEYFQKDYWNLSQYDLLTYACENDSREQMKVWILPTNTIYFMPPEHRYRIIHVVTEDDADYIVTNYTASYEEERLRQYYLYDEPKAIVVDNVKISSLLRRAYDVSMGGILLEKDHGAGLRYNANGVVWDIAREGEDTVLHGVSPQEIPLDKLFVSSDQVDVMESLRVSVSSDGNTFTELPLVKEYPSVDSDRSSFLEEGMGVKEIVLRHQAGEEVSFDLRFLARRTPDGGQVKPLTLVSEARASQRPEQAAYGFDGNRDSRWTSGIAQTEGMYYEITLKEPVELCGLMLDTYTSTGDEGRNLSILYKEDVDGEWKELPVETEDNIYYTLSVPSSGSSSDASPDSLPGSSPGPDGKSSGGGGNPYMKVGALRFEVGSVEKGNINNWSIHELNLFVDSKGKLE